MAILETSLGHMMIAAVIGAGSLLAASTASDMSFSDAQRLLGVCISGGIGGGLVGVILFPLSTVKQTALKWVASSIAAGIFGPASCQYFAIDHNLFYSLAMAGSIGLTAWGVLLIVVPLVGDSARRALKRWFPSIFGQIGNDILRSRRTHPGDWIEGSESAEDADDDQGGKPNEFGSPRR